MEKTQDGSQATSSNQVTSSNQASGTPVIAYIHNLSPLKTSQSTKNTYFDMNLQTAQRRVRAVCFSAEKHQQFKAKYESSSPVKFESYSLKRNTRTCEDEVHFSKRSRLIEPNDDEVRFDFLTEDAKDSTLFPVTTVENIKNTATKICVLGRVTFTGNAETIITKNKSKTLKKQDGTFTDNTGSIRIVLWEDDITKITSGTSYKLTNVSVKKFQATNYLTLNKHSIITNTEELIERDDEPMESNLKEVLCPPKGIKSINTYRSCTQCKTKVAPAEGKKIAKCTECGYIQLVTTCQTKMFANTVYTIDNNEELSLALFEDKLELLHNIYIAQDAEHPHDFNQCSEDDILNMLLQVTAKLVYNSSNNVIQVKKC